MYVAPDRLRELLPDVAAGATWEVGADTFTEAQLERLDEDGWLFVVSDTRCIAVVRAPQIANQRFAGGSALICDRDITHLLPRLGCLDGNVARWAAIPRIVPPSDLDLLAYELGLADDDPIAPLVPDDDRANELRAAVWDDPEADDARLVYADYLQDRGDPRGELIGLQVGRARTGEPVSDRERQLARRIAAACAAPLTPYLAPDFILERGFVARCTVNDVPMPPDIASHRAWRTVEDLTTTNLALLVNPQLRARRVGVGAHQLLALVDHPSARPFETIVGIAPLGTSQSGVWLDESHIARLAGAPAFEHLRALSVNATSPPAMSPAVIAGTRAIAVAVLRSPLGRRLHQLDAFIASTTPELQRWRDAFDASDVSLLTLRFIPAEPDRFGHTSQTREVLVALRRTARAPHLLVQVSAALPTDHVTVLVRVVAQLARGIQYAELHDFESRTPGRNAALLERLRAMFQQVVVDPPSARRLAP